MRAMDSIVLSAKFGIGRVAFIRVLSRAIQVHMLVPLWNKHDLGIFCLSFRVNVQVIVWALLRANRVGIAEGHALVVHVET